MRTSKIQNGYQRTPKWLNGSTARFLGPPVNFHKIGLLAKALLLGEKQATEEKKRGGGQEKQREGGKKISQK